jgi:hypothetical protein
MPLGFPIRAEEDNGKGVDVDDGSDGLSDVDCSDEIVGSDIKCWGQWLVITLAAHE